MANITQEIERLAAEIGENIYIDVANWHLYLTEAHLHKTVAQKVYSLLEDNELTDKELEGILRNIPVKLGGKKDVPLLDLLPEKCLVNLRELLEEYQKNL
jgi:Protein of unknown function (DUF3181)